MGGRKKDTSRKLESEKLSRESTYELIEDVRLCYGVLTLQPRKFN
jgi:hypothetical protein